MINDQSLTWPPLRLSYQQNQMKPLPVVPTLHLGTLLVCLEYEIRSSLELAWFSTLYALHTLASLLDAGLMGYIKNLA